MRKIIKMFLEGFIKVEKNSFYRRDVSLHSIGSLGIGVDIYEEIAKPQYQVPAEVKHGVLFATLRKVSDEPVS